MLRALRGKRQRALDGRVVRTPKLKNRSPDNLPGMTHKLSLLPTRPLQEACLDVWLTGAQHGWGDPRWVAYFRRTFLHSGILGCSMDGVLRAVNPSPR